MAISPPPPASPSGGKESITQTLRGKALGLPVWVWGLLLVALVALYLWRKKSQSSTAASTATTGTTTSGSTGLGTTDPTNAAYLAGMQAATTTPATAATPAGAAGYTAPTNEVQSGSGYSPPASAPNSPVTDAAGNEYTCISTNDQWSGLAASGAKIYYQPLPGVFLVDPPGLQGLALNTAQWYMSLPAGTGSGGKASGGVVPVRARMASAPRQPGGVASGGGLVSGLGTSMQSVPVHPSSP